MRFSKVDGSLYYADAYYGLLVVGPEGGVATVLTQQAGVPPQPIKFANDLDIHSNGSIFFTDSSTRHNRLDHQRILRETENTGKLLRDNELQEYKYGDLMHCEHLNNDFSGREAQVKFICGTCHNIAGCKGDFGCICNITYDHDMCKVKILAAVKCGRKGPRIFPDLSVGLQPRGSEVVKNGITQREYYKPFRNYSFWSNQKEVSLYVTTKDSFPGNIETTYIQVDSSQGLLVRIVRRSAVRFHIGGERITLLQAEWKCKNASEQPYEANIRIPVKGYDPIEFSLFTFCSDSKIGSDISDWKILGSVSFLILIGVALFWFAYKLKLQGHEIRSLCTVPLIHEDNPKANEEEGLSEVGAEVALV